MSAKDYPRLTYTSMANVWKWAEADRQLLQPASSRSGSSPDTRSRSWLNLYALCQRQCILDDNAQIPHGIFNLGVTKKDLNRSQVA